MESAAPAPAVEPSRPVKPAVADRLKAALDEPSKEVPKASPPPVQREQAAPRKVLSATEPQSAAPSPAPQPQRAAPRTVAAAAEPQSAAPPPAPKPLESPPVPASIFIGKPVPLAEFSAENWAVIFPQLTLTGVTRSIASHCAFVSVQGKACSLLLDTRHAALFNEEHRKRIEQALAEYFGTALQVAIETGTPSSETPAARRLRLEDERKLAAVRDFTHDPAVQALVDRFGAEIQYDSITSLAPPHQ